MSDSDIDFEALLADPEASKNIPKGLREWAQRQAEAAKTEREGAEKLRAELRASTVNNFLRDKGLPADVAGMIPEGAEPSEWYEKYGKFIAGTPAGQAANEPPAGDEATGNAGAPPAAAPPAPPTAPGAPAGMNADQLAAYQAIQGATPGAHAGPGPDSHQGVHDQITETTKGAQSLEEYVAKLKQIPGAVQGY
jgi:hypothetical protein